MHFPQRGVFIKTPKWLRSGPSVRWLKPLLSPMSIGALTMTVIYKDFFENCVNVEEINRRLSPQSKSEFSTYKQGVGIWRPSHPNLSKKCVTQMKYLRFDVHSFSSNPTKTKDFSSY